MLHQFLSAGRLTTPEMQANDITSSDDIKMSSIHDGADNIGVRRTHVADNIADDIMRMRPIARANGARVASGLTFAP
jgi:hypothetical protein